MSFAHFSINFAATGLFFAWSLAALAIDQNLSISIGSETEIVSKYKTEEQRRNGTSSSSGQDILIERVISVQDNGTELEYDLSKKSSLQERSRIWQFPVRIFRSNDGQTKLINFKEIDTRLNKWLADSGLSRDHCGRWVFTWNAFKIDCNLQAIVNRINNDFLGPIVIGEGSQYRTIDAQGYGELKRIYFDSNGGVYTVLLQIDPEIARRTRAEADVAVAQIMQKKLTLEDAIRQREKGINLRSHFS